MAAFVKGEPRPPGAGRKKGAPNKATASIRELAQKHAPEAMGELIRLARHARSEMTRVCAIREILDRGYGKSKATLEGELYLGISLELSRLLQAHDGQSRSIPLRASDNSTDDDKALPAPNGDAEKQNVH